MIEAIMIVASPFIVTGITSLTKNISVILNSGIRITLVRAIVAVLSLITAILSQAIGEGTLDPSLIDTTVMTVVNAGVATFLYLATKK